MAPPVHTTIEVLLGQEAFALIHMKGINWNANIRMMKLFLELRSLTITSTMAVAGLGIEGAISTMNDLLMVTRESEAALNADSHATVDDQRTIHTCSFTPTTQVTAAHGKQSIGTLQIGEKVLAYNPQTHKMEMQPILHVWVHTDNDLIDLTIATPTKGHQGASSKSKSEVVHTNQKHPFLTTEYGFVPVGQIKVGMHVVGADGSIGVIAKWTIVPGVKMMYNLEVAQDHTFTVGAGQWVVHNCGPGQFDTLPNDAFRAAQKDGSLGLRVRPQELNPDGTVKIGISHTEDPSTGVLRGPFYRLPAGTQAPEGTIFNRSWSSYLKAWHVGIEPLGPMSPAEFNTAVETLRSLYQFFGV